MPADATTWVIAILIAVVIVAGGALYLGRHQVQEAYDAISHGRRLRHRPPRDHFRQEDRTDESPRRRIAVIVNPTKLADVGAAQQQIAAGCAAVGWGEPLWFATTSEDPGFGQAKEAIAQGAAMVCPLGGDGTARQVARALVGTETPMGLLPGGTANLLSRNLDLPASDLDKALAVALTGQNKRIDVGWLSVDERPEEMFLVMAGLGFDGAVMAQTDENLKSTMGAAAYTVSGFRNWLSPRFRIEFSVDGQHRIVRRTRTVVFGNCGKIYGGLVLMPDARVDDGVLDTLVLSPRGVVGWTAVFLRVVTRNHRGHERMDHHRGSSFRVVASEPQEVQVDGDSLGPGSVVEARVEPGALLVRIGA